MEHRVDESAGAFVSRDEGNAALREKPPQGQRHHSAVPRPPAERAHEAEGAPPLSLDARDLIQNVVRHGVGGLPHIAISRGDG